MATEVKSTIGYKVAAIAIVALIVGALGGYFGHQEPVFDTSSYTSEISGLKSEKATLTSEIADLNKVVAEKDAAIAAAGEKYNADVDLELLREKQVKEIAENEFKSEYLDELNLDEEEFSDFKFSYALVNVNLDEEESDYEVVIDALVFQKDKNGNVVDNGIKPVKATMTVTDTDAVKRLNIEFVVA